MLHSILMLKTVLTSGTISRDLQGNLMAIALSRPKVFTKGCNRANIYHPISLIKSVLNYSSFLVTWAIFFDIPLIAS